LRRDLRDHQELVPNFALQRHRDLARPEFDRVVTTAAGMLAARSVQSLGIEPEEEEVSIRVLGFPSTFASD
jgi:hypothetical protein